MRLYRVRSTVNLSSRLVEITESVVIVLLKFYSCVCVQFGVL